VGLETVLRVGWIPLKEAEKQEKLSKEASKVSAELALVAADLRRQARLLKTKSPVK
jgi:hypothetical protein